MKKILNVNTSINRGQSIDVNLNRIFEQYKNNINKMKAYYRANYVRVAQTNPFISLVWLIMDMEATSSEVYNLTKIKKEELASTLGFTSSIHRGQTFADDFWNSSTGILVNTFYSASDILQVSNWMEMSPVRVLAIPSIADSMVRPDRALHEDGIGVIEVDIPAFAFMWSKWNEYNVQKPVQAREQVTEFLGRYVFPNMLDTQADAFVVQALLAEDFDLAKVNNTPLAIPDTAYKLCEELKEFTEDLPKGYILEQVATNLPAMTSDSQLASALKLREIDTQSNYWLTSYAYMPLILTCLNIARDNPEGDELVNILKKELKRQRSENTIRKIDDEYFSLVYETLLLKIKEKIM